MCYETTVQDNLSCLGENDPDSNKAGKAHYYYNWYQAVARGIVQPGYYLPTKDQIDDLKNNQSNYQDTYLDVTTWDMNGVFLADQLDDFASVGRYWSCTETGQYGFTLSYDGTTIDVGSGGKGLGLSVRYLKDGSQA